MTGVALSARTVVLRGLRTRCPACGEGRIFPRGFVSAASCERCGFVLERGEGHWVGGNEINLLVTYPVCVAALAVPAIVWGGNWATAAVGGVLAIVLGVAIHRPARGLFFAIDYLVEPDWRPPEDADGGGRDGPGGGGPGDGGDTGPSGGAARRGGPRPRTGAIELPVPTPDPRRDPEPAPGLRPAPERPRIP